MAKITIQESLNRLSTAIKNKISTKQPKFNLLPTDNGEIWVQNGKYILCKWDGALSPAIPSFVMSSEPDVVAYRAYHQGGGNDVGPSTQLFHAAGYGWKFGTASQANFTFLDVNGTTGDLTVNTTPVTGFAVTLQTTTRIRKLRKVKELGFVHQPINAAGETLQNLVDRLSQADKKRLDEQVDLFPDLGATNSGQRFGLQVINGEVWTTYWKTRQENYIGQAYLDSLPGKPQMATVPDQEYPFYPNAIDIMITHGAAGDNCNQVFIPGTNTHTDFYTSNGGKYTIVRYNPTNRTFKLGNGNDADKNTGVFPKMKWRRIM